MYGPLRRKLENFQLWDWFAEYVAERCDFLAFPDGTYETKRAVVVMINHIATTFKEQKFKPIVKTLLRSHIISV